MGQSFTVIENIVRVVGYGAGPESQRKLLFCKRLLQVDKFIYNTKFGSSLRYSTVLQVMVCLGMRTAYTTVSPFTPTCTLT